jgi:hypothetical protein
MAFLPFQVILFPGSFGRPRLKIRYDLRISIFATFVARVQSAAQFAPGDFPRQKA